MLQHIADIARNAALAAGATEEEAHAAGAESRTPSPHANIKGP